MQDLSEVFQSSRERPLALRRRPDLVTAKHVYRNEPYWMIKDPLEMEFYRLNEEEYAVLTLVDGVHSLDQIKSEFEAKYPSQRITARELQMFISDLNSKSLLAYSSPDVGSRLIERAKEKRWIKIKQNLSNIMSFKWRGVDPDRFLDWLTPKVGWIFSLPAVVCALIFMAAACLWVLVHADTFVTKLPALTEFLQPQNWLLLTLAIMVMKVVHELGHGVCFKRFGGECHEIGVMFMLFIPTLYCSTTDSWLLQSKWKRAAIGAAGMYVELLIAASATFAWWFSQPGTINLLCLNIMATGSLSVFIFNGNPFLKYDGYYILSDILELPNLLERAGKVTQSWFLKYGLGIDEDAEPNSRFDTKLTLVTYRLLAFGFRILILGTILFLMIDRLSPLGLGYLGLILGSTTLLSLFVPPMFGLYKFFKIPGRLHRMRIQKSIPTFLIISVVLGLVCLVPFPYHIFCSFTIQPRGGQTLYIKEKAILKSVHVVPGQTVAKGQTIAELINLDTLLSLTKLKAEGDEVSAELELLERGRESSPDAAAKISKLQESLTTNIASRKKYEEILESFHIVAPRDGQVIPEWTSRKPDTSEGLGTWDGSPLDEENLGTWLESGDKLCSVGDLSQLEAVLAVNEHDIGLLREGQTVSLMLNSHAGKRLVSHIESIARNHSEQLPNSLSSKYGGSIQLEASKNQRASQRPTDEHFEARVAITESDMHLSSGLRGQARIRIGFRTIFQRIELFFYRNFRKKL